MANAFLIDYEWCTGCHSCEIACQMLHDLPPQQFGVKLNTVGPWEYGDEKWVLKNIPFFTDQCNQCGDRQAHGQLPTCVQHCQAQCLKYGNVEDMIVELRKKPHQIIQVL